MFKLCPCKKRNIFSCIHIFELRIYFWFEFWYVVSWKEIQISEQWKDMGGSLTLEKKSLSAKITFQKCYPRYI
jgi:hypothetical protein